MERSGFLQLWAMLTGRHRADKADEKIRAEKADDYLNTPTNLRIRQESKDFESEWRVGKMLHSAEELEQEILKATRQAYYLQALFPNDWVPAWAGGARAIGSK